MTIAFVDREVNLGLCVAKKVRDDIGVLGRYSAQLLYVL